MARNTTRKDAGAKGSPPTQPVNGSEEVDEKEIEQRILHLLSVYPVISPTMLQGGLGPYTKPAVWRPVLDRLLAEGKVEESQHTMMTPRGRYNTYSKLHLRGTTVDVPNSVLEG